MASSQEFNNDSSKQNIVDLSSHYLDMLFCPLDSNHKLRRHRMPYHLLKCKKNFPDKIQCPFDHLFYCDKHAMAEHKETCPFKPKIDQAHEVQDETKARQDKPSTLTYNYDVDNYTINEPNWD